MNVFRVRLNCIDTYQAVPTRHDPILRNDVRTSQFSKEPKVPVVRVFGSTETGQKVCAHIHGAFPYLFIEYSGSIASDEVGAYIYRLHLSIDHALAVSYRRDVYGAPPKFVARITLVKGVPFYGYHVGYRFFLKIYMLNPMVMTRLADLLQQGLIMSRKFQPYEAHLQYLLQFMTDYNLYGCAYLETRAVTFRAPVPVHSDDEDSPHLWHSQSISAEDISDESSLPRVSHCSIEVDICVQHILNREAIHGRSLHHDFVERKHPIPSDLKLVHSMAGLWKDETRRRKRRMRNPRSGSSPFPPEVLISMSADPRDSQPPGWIHEDEYREQIRGLIVEEDRSIEDQVLSFDGFVEEVPLADTVNTVLQSVEDLFPANLAPIFEFNKHHQPLDYDPKSSIIVDEKGILEVGDNTAAPDLFPDDSDEEFLREIALAEEATKTIETRESSEKLPEKLTIIPSPSEKDGIVSKRDVSNTGPHGSSADSARQTVDGFGIGVCASGLRSEHPSIMPLYGELIAEARSEGLVSRYPQSDDPKSGPGATLKRAQEFFNDRDGIKRAKLDPLAAARSQTEYILVNGQKKSVSQQSKRSTHPDNASRMQDLSVSQQKKRDGNGDSAKRHRALGFPVVKDPNDPSTMLRLSQQASSQRSEDGMMKNLVSPQTSLTKLEKPPSRNITSEELSSLPTSSSLLSADSEASKHESPMWYRQKMTVLVGSNPPSVMDVAKTINEHGAPDVIYQDAFYKDEKDVPPRKREYAGREFRIESNTLPYLPEFDGLAQSPATFGIKQDFGFDRSKMDLKYERQRRQCTLKSWEFAQPPPLFEEVSTWWLEKRKARTMENISASKRPLPSQTPRKYQSQIDGPIAKNKHGFKYSQKPKSTSVEHEAQYMSTMSLEIHVNTRGNMVPNPEEDEVQCIFWCISADGTVSHSTPTSESHLSGIIVLSPDGALMQRIRKQTSVEVVEEAFELDLMVRMVEIVRTHDPDILTGYEVHGSSWGYLIERARFKYDYNLCDEFSRMKSQSHGRFGKEADRWGFNTTSTIRVTGRHMINVWRAMRGELNLLQYTMENVVWHLLHRRIPHYSWKTLTTWYNNGRHRDLAKVIRYYLIRAKLDLQILDANELIPRTSEQARLLGVDFFSVFSRGSQFKVESIMFRIAKPENFLLVSPSKKQVGGQNALECLPLVMEPQSAFFNSPLLVLDFQSLYPSIMIAYNYCYSTFLGRIANWRGMSKMGFTEYKRQLGLLRLLKEHINIAPNGIMYVKAGIRKSLLAKMLTEILETRIMVKSGMKQDKEDRTLQQLLNNRQLALKLLANVTYGYTSASFSGRMPCSEIADSIVQTARETLERSIAFIHSVERWGAEVVYGDTDSLFIYLKGRTRHQAFDIGEEIAKTITDMNPRPVKLKFEKVYHPCVLLAKKRYVGYKYESRHQAKPEFDAKGIETVRRDGTPAEQKIEEKALRLLFETADLSQVKAYFQAQCDKIMRGAVSVQDFCFAKEVRLGTYSDKGPPPPGALISTRKMLEDARAEPQYGERVPYVVITGAPGARLIDRCVAPEDLLNNPHCTLDAEYYISKNLVPPLERIFNLVGANVRQWYDEMPKIQRIRRVDASLAMAKKTLESYLKSASCVVCGVKMRNEGAICGRCRRDATASSVRLQTRLNVEEQKLGDIVKVCQTCAALAPLDDVPCDSKDCPVFYTRVKQTTRLRTERSVLEPVIKQLESDGFRIGREALLW